MKFMERKYNLGEEKGRGKECQAKETACAKAKPAKFKGW